MKFSKSLLRNEVPGWAQWYVDYKGLKRHVRQAAEQVKNGDFKSLEAGAYQDPYQDLDSVYKNPIYAPFFQAVDSNLQTVDLFYGSKFYEYNQRLSHLQTQTEKCQTQNGSSNGDYSELLILLFELRAKMRNLQWYADVNKRGFIKILKKMDKKAGTNAQTSYTELRLSTKEFADGSKILSMIKLACDLIQKLSTDSKNNSMQLSSSNDALQSLNSMQMPQKLGLSSGLIEAVDKNDDLVFRSLMENEALTPKQADYLLLRAFNCYSANIIRPLVEACHVILATGCDNLNGRNVLHKAILNEGRKHQTTNTSEIMPIPEPELSKPEEEGINDERNAATLNLFLQVYSEYENLYSLLTAIDHQLYTPLCYAVKNNLRSTTKTLLNWNSLCLQFKDCDGYTPVDLAVMYKSPGCLSELLKFSPPNNPRLLLTAVHLNALKVCEALIDEGKYNINFQNQYGETALHLAVREHNIELVSLLLSRGASLEIKEYRFQWTPLFIAAVEGFEDIVCLLIEYGANAMLTDNSGWTAKEHAAFRGHLQVAKNLPMPDFNDRTAVPDDKDILNQDTFTRKREQYSKLSPLSSPKAFENKFLETEGECLVLLTLGSKDLRQRDLNPVTLDFTANGDLGDTSMNSAMSLMVSATPSNSDACIVDLPIPELGMSTEPIPFYTINPESLSLVFDLVSSSSKDTNKKPFARGIFSLPKFDKFQRLDKVLQSVPIIEAQTLKKLGTVHFEVLVVKPFAHLNNNLKPSSGTYWRSLVKTKVIGHRGLGKNTLEQTSLQLGENTIESFIQASNLGANYVEFDVQITKDSVPVIYHDFLVSESGYDLPMHAISLDQFMQIHEPHEERGRSSTPVSELEETKIRPRRARSVHSRQGYQDPMYEDTLHKMRHTRDYKMKGYKGNVRGLHIQSKFATLAELFDTLPEDLGFNIEFKFPMLDEAEAEDMDCLLPDINLYVDTVLKVIFDNKRDRDIIFSSFNPDVCVLLSFKQPSIPVLFLTESGTELMQDIRASSLQEAIRFAKRFNLLGIVSASEPLIMCSRLVKLVKESGLVLFTYGTPNNVPENASLQLKSGVDAVIVDSVLAIKNALTKLEIAESVAGSDECVRGFTAEAQKSAV